MISLDDAAVSLSSGHVVAEIQVFRWGLYIFEMAASAWESLRYPPAHRPFARAITESQTTKLATTADEYLTTLGRLNEVSKRTCAAYIVCNGSKDFARYAKTLGPRHPISQLGPLPRGGRVCRSHYDPTAFQIAGDHAVVYTDRDGDGDKEWKPVNSPAHSHPESYTVGIPPTAEGPIRDVIDDYYDYGFDYEDLGYAAAAGMLSNADIDVDKRHQLIGKNNHWSGPDGKDTKRKASAPASSVDLDEAGSRRSRPGKKGRRGGIRGLLSRSKRKRLFRREAAAKRAARRKRDVMGLIAIGTSLFNSAAIGVNKGKISKLQAAVDGAQTDIKDLFTGVAALSQRTDDLKDNVLLLASNQHAALTQLFSNDRLDQMVDAADGLLTDLQAAIHDGTNKRLNVRVLSDEALHDAMASLHAQAEASDPKKYLVVSGTAGLAACPLSMELKDNGELAFIITVPVTSVNAPLHAFSFQALPVLAPNNVTMRYSFPQSIFVTASEPDDAFETFSRHDWAQAPIIRSTRVLASPVIHRGSEQITPGDAGMCMFGLSRKRHDITQVACPMEEVFDSPSAVSLGGAAYVLWSKHPVDARVTCPGQPTRIIDDVSAPIRVQLDDGCYFKGAFGDSLDLAGLNNVTAKPTIFDGASDVIRALLSAPPYVADEALQLALASLHEDEVWGNGSVPLRPPGYRGPPVHTTWIDDIGAGTAYTIITVASVILLGLTGVAIFSIVKAVTLRTAKIQAAVAGTGFKQAGDAVPVPFPAETGYIARAQRRLFAAISGLADKWTDAQAAAAAAEAEATRAAELLAAGEDILGTRRDAVDDTVADSPV